MVTFSFRNGPTAAPATPYWYKTDLVLPTYVSANLIVPPLFTVSAGDAELQSCKWSLSIQFGEDLDKDGAFLAGNGYGGEETVNHRWVGVPTSITSTGWIKTGGNASGIAASANTSYPTNDYTFVRKVTRVTS